MRTLLRLSAAVAGSAALALLFAGPSSAGEPGHHHTASAVFVQTDDPAGNTVVAYDRVADGTLTQAGSYPTGGLGGVLAGSVVDHLASQSSLVLDDGTLFVVNAGSNTVTTFAVAGDRLVDRHVVGSGGTFPVSIAVRDHLAYVVDALDGGTLQGYLRVGDRLVRIPSWQRPLGLDPNATPQFVNTPGQVAFTPDGRSIAVTTKANGHKVLVFGLERFGGPAAAPTVNLLPGDVPFALATDRSGHLVIAQAGNGAVASYDVSRSGTLTAVSSAATNAAATCWVARVGSYLYASNAGSASVSVVSDHGGSLTLSGATPTDPGTVDAAASPDGRFLYVQSGGAGKVDAFAIGHDGGLTAIGSVTVPNAVGGEGIAVS